MQFTNNIFNGKIIFVKGKKKSFENLEITDISSEGFGVAKTNEKVVFVKNTVPGEIVDVQIYKRKRRYLYGQVVNYKKLSPNRISPSCIHFGECGGCKLQFLAYDKQLYYKEKSVLENIKRIGKVTPENIFPVMASPKDFEYRNKLEFTFSNNRWMTQNEVDEGKEIMQRNALGFHVAGRFDKVLDIEKCWLQDNIVNEIRNAVRDFAITHQFSFYDLREQNGLLRNLIFRTTSTGELMVAFSFAEDDEPKIQQILNFTVDKFPQITTLVYFINPKKNDTLYDIDFTVVRGQGFITENLDGISYKIGPKSFFQTNSYQVLNLYRSIKELSGFKGDEIVYDLYTGTGSIALYIASAVKKVVGVESVPEAIVDAKENAALNKITNAEFLTGDMRDVFTPEFIDAHGKPDVIITDPPRAGMHPKVVQNLLFAAPEKIIYVSCNSATQARDLELLADAYRLVSIQPVDMFPQTAHVENIAVLVKRD